MPTAAQFTFSNLRLDPARDPQDARSISVSLDNSLTLAKGTVLAEKYGVNALYSVLLSGGITGGTFTITIATNTLGTAQTSAAIPWNATAPQIFNALQALTNVVGNINVYGGPAANDAVFYLEYINALGAQAITAPTVSVASLTGGTPAQTVTSVQTGAAGSPGIFAAYSAAATNGLQRPRCILQYPVTTDASGNITIGGDFSQTFKSVGAWTSGTFRTQDITGLDQNAVNVWPAHIDSGNLASGEVRFG